MRFESPGGDSSILQFKDSFGTVDPNSGTGLGANWIQAIHKDGVPIDPMGATSAIITPTNFDGANGFVVSSYAANPVNRWMRSLYVPIKGNFYQNLFGKSQHSQVQALQITGNFQLSVACGCCIYLSESVGSTGYFLDFETTNAGGTTWRVRKAVADSFSGNLASGNDVINGGDTLRLSVDLSVTGQATLTAKRNGVTLGTFVDSPTPITIGAPGLAVHIGDTGAGRAELRSFDGGGGL